MHICIYVYMFIYIYIYTYMCVCVYIYYIHTCTYVYAYTHKRPSLISSSFISLHITTHTIMYIHISIPNIRAQWCIYTSVYPTYAYNDCNRSPRNCRAPCVYVHMCMHTCAHPLTHKYNINKDFRACSRVLDDGSLQGIWSRVHSDS